ncbi:coiled-coil domain-containing protein 113 [Apis dorsata]|uniref:coiled-coil domain-containing protein 113 n=1 Tax=Apis dorsata TaxID=7462 RepID=UPI001293BA88|nr:coiled-coil domain-containing protein 113 [Apis dorsata]
MLHVIDFEKLKIENQDLAKLLEEKNLYVIDMKKIAGYYHLKLTQHKQKLNSLSVKLKELKEETMLKQKQIEEINIEYDIFAGQVKRQQKKLTQLLNFTENHTAPDILDFIKLQEEYVELEKSYKLLQRRRNIEKIIFEEYKKQTLWNEKN